MAEVGCEMEVAPWLLLLRAPIMAGMSTPSPSAPSSDRRFFVPAQAQVRERAVLVGVHFAARAGQPADYADLDELERLAKTAGAEVLSRVEQRRERPDSASLIGSGKAEQLRLLCEDLQSDLVIFDNDLAPAQARNLEKLLGRRVLDRTELILDIFVRHARTQQARLQVELAQYEYLLPRLTRMWKHLERQAGGIGTRGPGESQIETDRRIIRRRVAQLRRDLQRIERRMMTQHKQRQSEYRVALVGYTNAGKSSLMNRIARADVYVKDELFATLDATTRRVESPGAPAFLLTDTVGFIRKLPHHLVESFRATLSEAHDADLLLHVVDVSCEDPIGMKLAVDRVLEEIGAGLQPTQIVLNKIDLVGPERLHELQVEFPKSIAASAQSGDGIEDLLRAVAVRQHDLERLVRLRVPAHEARSIALVHEYTHVESLHWHDDCAWIEARVDGPNFGRILKLSGVELLETARFRRGY